MVVFKTRSKRSCLTFAEPHVFTAGRHKLSWLNFLLLEYFDFSWTATQNIKCPFSPFSPANATKYENPSASVIGEKRLHLVIRKDEALFPRKVQKFTSSTFKDPQNRSSSSLNEESSSCWTFVVDGKAQTSAPLDK